MPDESIRTMLKGINVNLEYGTKEIEGLRKKMGKAFDRIGKVDKELGERCAVIETDLKNVKEKCDDIIGGDMKAASWAGYKAGGKIAGGGGILFVLYQMLLALADKVPFLKFLLPGAD